MIEGSGLIPLASGSGCGSGRPKNMRIRIRNTDFYKHLLNKICRKRIRKTSLTIHSGIPTEAGTEIRNISFRTV
jgi:hypothetical protein